MVSLKSIMCTLSFVNIKELSVLLNSVFNIYTLNTQMVEETPLDSTVASF